MIDAKEMMETCSSCAGTGIAGHPDSGWICFDCNGDGAVAPNAAPDLAARVVELEAENATLKTEKHADAEAIGALRADVKRLRGALEFYADPDYDGYDVTITDYGISMEEGRIIKDAGDKARAALAAPEEGKE